MLSPNGVRAILFDLDGTLRLNRPSSTHTFFDFAVQLGAEDSLAKRLQAIRWTHYYWAQSQELVADLETYQGQEDLFWANYAQRHLLAFDCSEECARDIAPQVHRYMKEEYKPEDWVPPDVPETLEALQDAGFRLAVLSNRTRPYLEQLETLKLTGYFEFALAAGEVNIWKPAPEIFHHALQKLSANPEQALYVGDNYYADVIGAQNAGLKPVLIDPEGVFPDAECPVIQTMGELVEVLTHQ